MTPSTDYPSADRDHEPAGRSGTPAPSTDGRQLRRERNRDAVVEALLDLYQQGNLRPSTEEIATRAGLSPRSLFRYFDDVDDLTRAAMRRQQQRVQHLFPVQVDADRPLAARVEALVEQRLRLFDAIGPAATVARLRLPFQPALAEQIHQNRAQLRTQIERLFASELVGMSGDRGPLVLAAADVLTTFEAVQLLTDQGLGPDRVRAVIGHALMTLLESPD